MGSFQRLVVFLIVLLSFSLPTRSTAQTISEFEQVEVLLWPEYDRPEVLVIQKLRLKENTSLPAKVQLSLPSSVGAPHAIAEWNSDGSIGEELAWIPVAQGEELIIEVETPTSGIWLEYYDLMEMNGTARSYLFELGESLAADVTQYDILHPPASQGMTVTPAGMERVDANGALHTSGDLVRNSVEGNPQVSFNYINPAAVSLPPFTLAGDLQTFEDLLVTMWPEFDRDDTLIIYQVALPEEASLPSQIRLPVPTHFGDPSAVAFRNSAGDLVLASHSIEEQGDWSVLKVETESPFVWVEFYTDLWVEDGGRAFNFLWPGGMQINSLGYSIQQPALGTGMLVSPRGTFSQGEDDLVYFAGTLGSFSGEEQAHISFSYENPTGTLTVDVEVPPQAIERPQETQGGTPSLESLLPYLLAALGLVLVVGGVLMFLRGRETKRSAKRPRQRKRSKEPRTEADQRELDPYSVFCHVCGTQSSTSDRFCRQCGTQLRR